MYENIININEIVEIMNLLGRTEGKPINTGNIGKVDKVYRITKEDHSYSTSYDNSIKISIVCSDGIMLTIYGNSHYEDPLATIDNEYHTITIEYRLSNNSVIRFKAGLNLFFEKKHFSSMADAFVHLTSEVLTEDEYAGKLEGAKFEVLTPYFVRIREDGSEDIIKLQVSALSDQQAVWGNMHVDSEVSEIRDRLNACKFTREELAHLVRLLQMQIESLEVYQANKRADEILERASIDVLKAMRKKIGKYIESKKGNE